MMQRVALPKDLKLTATVRTRILLCSAAILFVEGYFLNSFPTVFAAVSLLLYLVYMKTTTKNIIKNLKICFKRETLETMKYANKPFTVKLNIRTNCNAHLVIQDCLPDNCALHPNSTEQITINSIPQKNYAHKYTLIPEAQGYCKFNDFKVVVKDFCNLFQYETTLQSYYETVVYPDLEHIKSAHTLAKKEQPKFFERTPDRFARFVRYEFDGIRDYMPGDRFRDIDWKASSRLLKLMTKIFERETATPVFILLDVSNYSPNERSVVVASQFAIQLAKILQLHEHPVGFIAYNANTPVQYITPTKEAVGYNKLLEALSKIPSGLKSIRDEKTLFYKSIIQPVLEKDDKSKNFIAKIGPFIVGRYSKHTLSTQATGVYEAVRTIVSNEPSKKAYIIIFITDLEMNFQALCEAAKFMIGRRNKCYLIAQFAHFYKPLKLTPVFLETLYNDYLSYQNAIKELRKIGVKVFEMQPSKPTRKILHNLLGAKK